MTQEEALIKLAPYIFAALGGAGGLWALVKGIAAFRDWLQETRRLVEEVPGLIAATAATASREATEARVAGGAARAAVELLRGDVDGLGGKINRIDTQQVRDGDRMGRTERDVEKLTAEYRASEKALPKLLEDERHAMRDGPLNNLSLRLDELKDDVKDRQRRTGE